jgi:hypothetical protein
MRVQVQSHLLFAIYTASLTRSSLPIFSQSGVLDVVEHNCKGGRVQDSRFYPMRSPSLIIVNIDMAGWIMRETESDCGTGRLFHFLPSSHRLKQLLGLGV